MPQQQPGAPVLVLENDVETSHYKMFKVLIHNDDVNDMVHVVRSLIEVFRFEADKAIEILSEAHT